MGGTPIAGEFIMGNPNKKWMMTGGTPIFRTPPNDGFDWIVSNKISDVRPSVGRPTDLTPSGFHLLAIKHGVRMKATGKHCSNLSTSYTIVYSIGDSVQYIGKLEEFPLEFNFD